MKLLHPLLLAFVVLFGSLGSTALQAQSYPSKSITLVVPYQAGGTNDILARIVGLRMSQSMGVPVIVENKPGASGNIGSQFVARAPADGYTVLVTTVGVFSINRWLHTNMGFDPEKDFAPITLAARVPNVLMVHPSVPATNMQELIAYIKANPGKLSFASQGAGSSGHLSGEMFKVLAGVDIVHVPYKGSAPAVNDLLGGHVQMMFDNLPTALPMAKSGRLRALAVTSSERHPDLPDVPTLAESGVKGFEATAAFGFFAPARTPKPVLERLHAEVVRALNEPQVKAQLTTKGVGVVANSSADFARVIAAESAKWKEVIERSGAKAN